MSLLRRTPRAADARTPRRERRPLVARLMPWITAASAATALLRMLVDLVAAWRAL